MTRKSLVGLGRCAVIAAAGIVLSAIPAGAQPDLSKPQGPTIAERGAPGYTFEKRVLPSRDGARRYRLYLAKPTRPAPPAGYPVIYMLDGNAAFEDLTAGDFQALDARGDPAVVVGIGYDTPLRFDVEARSFDYTPPNPNGAAAADVHHPERKTGGADIFLDFLDRELRPVVERAIPINRKRQAIYGHSYGGVFVLHALFTRPDAFQTYIAASPSLWWGDGQILREEAAAASGGPSLRANVLLMIGAGEQRRQPGPGRPASLPARMPDAASAVENLRALGKRLGNRPGLRVQVLVFPDKGHGQMFPASARAALRYAPDPSAAATVPE